MKTAVRTGPFNTTVLSGAISAALSIGVGLSVPLVAQADIFEFTFDNSGCSASPITPCGGAGDGVFSILDNSGKFIANSSDPYYSDPIWSGGVRTQIGGSFTIKETQGTTQGKGVATINPFDFFAGGPAVAQNISFEDIGDGSGTLGTIGAAGEKMWLGQMLFNWNSNNGIPVSLVWDLQGVVDNLAGLDVNNIANPANVLGSVAHDLTGAVGATPASDGLKKGSFFIGPSPVATTSFDTTSLCTTIMPDDCLNTNPSGALPLINDATGTSGTPMIDGPFAGSNANFDVAKLTLSGYNDTTPPTVTLGGATVNINVNDLFDINNPGVSVTCADNADGNDDLTVQSNANITFTVDNGNGGSTSPVDNTTAGLYEILYTCTDNASTRSAIASDPDNPSSMTVPTDNTSDNTTVLTVNVVAAGQPVITITNGTPTAHEACTVYNDAGATAVDSGGAPLTPVIVTDNNLIIGNSLNEVVATIDYDISDAMVAATTQTRTVTVTDTVSPAINIVGGAAVTIESNEQPTYTNPLATAIDANGDCNPVVGGVATTPDTVNFTIPAGLDSLGSTLRYFASDVSTAANQSQSDQVVTVERSEPVITISGGGVVLAVGGAYVEQGMDIHDVQDGDITGVTASGTASGVGAGMGTLTYVIDSSLVDINIPGNYSVTYDVTDSDTNTATQVVRTVAVGGFAADSNFSMLDANGNVFGGTNDVFFDWDGASYNTDAEDTNFGLMTIASVKPQPFFSFVWDAHHVRVYEGPVTLMFDTTCTVAQLESGLGSQANPCNGPLDPGQTQQFMPMVVAAGQVGAHILFDWNTSSDIDVVNVWDVDGVWNRHGGTGQNNKLWDGPAGLPPEPTTTWKLISTDYDGDGINASPMLDGPFQGSAANFNAGPAATTGPTPPYVDNAPDTDIGSGLASVTIWGLISGLASLLGFRRFTKKR
jgi:hypothetical protein